GGHRVVERVVVSRSNKAKAGALFRGYILASQIRWKRGESVCVSSTTAVVSILRLFAVEILGPTMVTAVRIRIGVLLLSLAALLPTTRPARAIPAFASQTGQPCT